MGKIDLYEVNKIIIKDIIINIVINYNNNNYIYIFIEYIYIFIGYIYIYILSGIQEIRRFSFQESF